ncbi:T9SS type A sorting domain-containing protein [bacterium]|nr:T9SS type A sorting domain-containing protein [bacterium]MBU1936360.1 T9SS type A sorting domain-containing protein [bacterium]
MKNITLLLLLGFLCLRPADAQTLLGMDWHRSFTVPYHTITMAEDDEVEGKLWFIYQYGEVQGQVDYAYIYSTDGDSFSVNPHIGTVVAANGFLITMERQVPGDPSCRYWVYVRSKRGDVVWRAPIYGNSAAGTPIRWGSNVVMTGITDAVFNPNAHVLDDLERGSLYCIYSPVCDYNLGVYRCTLYQDSVWADYFLWPTALHWTHGLLHDPYRGGTFLISEWSQWSVYVYPETFTGIYPPPLEHENPDIGCIYSLAGSTEDHLYVLAGRYEGEEFVMRVHEFVNSNVHTDLHPIQPSRCQLSAFPNPTNGAITLFLSEPLREPGDVIIYDLLGRQVQKVILNSAVTRVDISGLPSGLYFARMDNAPTLRLQLLK